jgi:hypothetical protein
LAPAPELSPLRGPGCRNFALPGVYEQALPFSQLLPDFIFAELDARNSKKIEIAQARAMLAKSRHFSRSFHNQPYAIHGTALPQEYLSEHRISPLRDANDL